MLVLELILALTIAGAWLTGTAVLRNNVPVTAPPGRLARLRTYLTSNVAETKEDHRFPELRTRSFDGSATELRARVAQAMKSLGWNVSNGGDPMTLRAVIKTPLLGFSDDLTATVESASDFRSKLVVRSSSRVGRGDLGANAGHILRLYEAVGQAIDTGPRDD